MVKNCWTPLNNEAFTTNNTLNIRTIIANISKRIHVWSVSSSSPSCRHDSMNMAQSEKHCIPYNSSTAFIRSPILRAASTAWPCKMKVAHLVFQANENWFLYLYLYLLIVCIRNTFVSPYCLCKKINSVFTDKISIYNNIITAVYIFIIQKR